MLEDAGITVKVRHFSGWGKIDELVIATIRDPQATKRSWLARKRDQDFDYMWHIFEQAYKTQKMFILPIDTDDRQKQLDELSKLLGVKLLTDWKAENESNHDNQEFTDLSHIYKLSVVDKYYGKKEVKKRKKKR